MPLRKKGVDLVLNFTIGLFLFIVVVFAGIPLIVKMYRSITGQASTATVNSLDMIVKTIKYTEQGETEVVPVYVDSKHLIRGFEADADSKPTVCRDSACLCVCKKDGCSSEGIVRCSILEYYIPSVELSVTPFVIETTDKTTNYAIEVTGGHVTLQETPVGTT